MTLTQPALVVVAIFVAYMAIVGVLWRVTGTRYDHLVDSRDTVLKGIVMPIGAGAVFLAIVTTVLGWWPDALFEAARSGPGWAWAVPILFALVAVVNIGSIDYKAVGARILPLLLVGTLLVGFAEELVARGILVVGFRQAGASEWVVWLGTTLLFSLLHAMNALFGQSIAMTAGQLVTTFIAGTALYVTLMVTGNLVVGMVLHALWDFGTLGLMATGRTQRPVALVLVALTFVIALVSVGFVVS